MPRTGRPPQPTEVKIAKGERRASRINYNAPTLPPVSRGIDPPKGLRGAGLEEWLRIASQLATAGVLKDPDLPAMEDYCRRLTDLRETEGELDHARENAAAMERAIAKKEEGADLDRLVMTWKLIASLQRQVIQLQAQVNVLRREIGATPSSRSAVKVPPAKDADSAADKAKRYMVALRGGRA